MTILDQFKGQKFFAVVIANFCPLNLLLTRTQPQMGEKDATLQSFDIYTDFRFVFVSDMFSAASYLIVDCHRH